jgi:hypothetical protein
MDEWKSQINDINVIIDGHVHMRSAADEATLLEIREATGIAKMSLVSIQDPPSGKGLPQSLYMKARHAQDKRFFVFAGLNHAEKLSNGRVKTPSPAQQAQTFLRIGCDGIKMIEGKPTSRQVMDVPVTDPYFADYWACVEELGVPIVWHVADPEEFWDPTRIPGWAKERAWGYSPSDVQKEQLYDEVDEVLARYPSLNIIFPHFYFLSADLDRVGSFLDGHPSAYLDLAPGIEMLYNLSRDPRRAREFFITYAKRIVFGTDISSQLTVEEGSIRAGVIFRWLETEDTYRVPEAADFLLGPPEDGVIHGLSLPKAALQRIYCDNYVQLVGPEPRPLDIERAIEECERIASIAEALTGIPAADTEAGLVARSLARKRPGA